jgi:HK97 family phage portal protein
MSTTRTFDLAARPHVSRVLGAHMAANPDAARRANWQAPVAAGENGVTTNLTAEELMSVLGLAGASAAGVQVTPETAMRVTTVYACVALVAGAVATLPIGIYERKGQERSKADHDYWWFLNEQACEEFTTAAAWEYLVCAKMFYGDGFAELLRPSMSSSRVIGWRPLHPLRVQPFQTEDGRTYYRYQPQRGEARVLDPADVLHVPSLGFDGLTSPSPITYAAREAVGTTIAADAYMARFFSEGATFDYALKTDAKLTKDQAEVLRASLVARSHSGGAASRAPLILTGGLAPAQLSINPKDAEILGTRQMGVEEICRALGVPPHMVGHTDKVTSWGSGIEQQGIGFVRYTLQRHLTPIAQELNRKLWPTRSRYFVEHITAALERGDIKSRYEAYRIALGRAGEQPWTDSNEIRRLENMPPNDNLKPNGGASAPQQTPAAAG